MAVVTIFAASHCRAEQVVEGVAARAGLRRVDDAALLAHAAQRFGLPVDKLDRAMHGAPSVFNRLTRERERGIAYLQSALAELAQPDGIVYLGFAGHLLPRTLTHVLRVCLVAKPEHRAAVAAATLGVTPREAEKVLARDDEAARQWTLRLAAGLGPWNAGLYDIVVPLDATSVDDAAVLIAENAAKPPLRTTPAARAALDDFLLSCRVNVALVEAGHDVDVTATAGRIMLTINRYVMRLEHHEQELKAIAGKVPGVAAVETKVGPNFQQPNIYPMVDLPTKVLLVDDEQEFVQTLSERLQTRNIEAAVAYDGEQALAIAKDDAPEVMVLDLKMPGIDGLEVLRRVKREHPATEVIILTGHGSAAEEELARQLGAFAYLNKPVDVDVLAETMKAAYQRIGARR